jgi:hypothetical protein
MERKRVGAVPWPHRLFPALSLASLPPACSNGGGSSTANVPPPGGVFETDFGPGDSALDLTHTAVVRLEASGTHDGDSHGEEGVDEIPYFFEQPAPLTLDVG